MIYHCRSTKSSDVHFFSHLPAHRSAAPIPKKLVMLCTTSTYIILLGTLAAQLLTDILWELSILTSRAERRQIHFSIPIM